MSSATKSCVQSSDEIRTEKKKKVKKIFCLETITLIEKLKKLENTNKKYIDHLQKAIELGKNVSFTKAIKNFARIASMFRLMQFKMVIKNKMGRKKLMKVMSLKSSIKNPIVYKWLKKISAPTTPNPVLKPGINEKVFMQLKEVCREELFRSERLCVLLFDRIAVMPHLDYNRKKDIITGFVNDGKSSKMDIADHVLVFMIRGVVMNYKQPISYTFCNRTVNSDLSAQIVDVIKKLHRAGFIIISTVCSEAASNTKAIDDLIKLTKSKYELKGEEFTQNVFEVDGRKIIPLYDPPHLIKAIRNNMLERNLRYSLEGKEKTAMWNHIIMLYGEKITIGDDEPHCVVGKLTDNHVYRKEINKKSVYVATQVFSRTAGAYLGFMAERGILPNECTDTANLLIFFDKLFDSVNGSYRNFKEKEIPLLRSARDVKNSIHKKTWSEAKDVLASMKFINENGDVHTVQAINCWLKTIENFELLLKTIPKHNLESVWLRRFNLDPLENLFGRIRNYCGRNMSPTCVTFETAYKRILIKNIRCSNSQRSNCESDSCTSLKAMDKSVFMRKTATSVDEDYENLFEEFSELDEKTKNLKILTEFQYVSEYVIKNIKRKF